MFHQRLSSMRATMSANKCSIQARMAHVFHSSSPIRKVERNGKNPVYLYGYGGFNIAMPPYFSSNRIPFLEIGGIYAQACLRGGSEYGEEWHLAGTKMNKQNVFDDFISAGEWLIKNKYTSKDYLAIVGGSNGGLLVGACMTQRPDLFKVCIPEVGVMDMLRYHKFTIGWNWAPDYGTSADSKEMFEYLKGYSPLHNLRPGTHYPATLITTADHDDRVVPAHSSNLQLLCKLIMQETRQRSSVLTPKQDTEVGNLCRNSWRNRLISTALSFTTWG